MTTDCGQCFPNHDQALTQLHSVYSSPTLSHLDDVKNNDFFQSIGNAVISFFNRLFGGAGSAVGLVVFLVIVALLAGLVVSKVFSGSASRKGFGLPEPPSSADPAVEWDAALAAAERGDYREAVRQAFRSALLSVALKGRMMVDPAWTNRELLQRANADADLLAALAPAAHIFEISWYSGQPTTEAMWQTQRERCQAIIALSRTPVPA
jgi:Domain of unknown function (DUF4129)